MEKIRKCPLLSALIISGVLFSLIGLIGRSSVYRGYEFSIISRPFLTLVMEGISRDTAPWEVFGIGAEAGETLSYAQQEGQSIGDIHDDEYTGEAQVLEGAEELLAEGQPQVLLGAQEVSGENAEISESGETEIEEADTEAFQTVPESYFNDAVFIGDSRTVGLYEYAGMEDRADFFAKTSLTIYDVFTQKVAKDEKTGRKITVEEALAQKQYGKVYLMLGINELGTGNTSSFMRKYTEVVDRIRQLQPDAVIFVQGIMRVTGAKNESDPIFNNTNINEKNAEIAKLADGHDIFYIDVNEAVCDEDGNLNEEYTMDEIHLKAKYYELWKSFLLEHGVVKKQ